MNQEVDPATLFKDPKVANELREILAKPEMANGRRHHLQDFFAGTGLKKPLPWPISLDLDFKRIRKIFSLSQSGNR